MYLKYYNFAEWPFLNNYDLRFEVATEKYQEARARLNYAIQEGNGFALLIGEAGTGKSFLITRIIQELPESYKVTRVSGAQLNAIFLLRSLCRAFKLKVSGTKEELIIQLNRYLNRQEIKEKAIVIIEDAHLLKPNFLEEIRLLSNLETAAYKLIQIILVGQPSFHQLLALPQLRQLKQRISIEAVLDRFNPGEMKFYLNERMRIAGRSDINVFSEQAINQLHQMCNGFPAQINHFADRALFFGYLQQQSQISHAVIQQVNLLEQHESQKNASIDNIIDEQEIAELKAPEPIRPFKRSRVRWITALFMIIFSVIFIYELNLNKKLPYQSPEEMIALNQRSVIDSLFIINYESNRAKNLPKEPAWLSFAAAVKQLAQFNQSEKSVALIKKIVNGKDTLYQVLVLPDMKNQGNSAALKQGQPIGRK